MRECPKCQDFGFIKLDPLDEDFVPCSECELELYLKYQEKKKVGRGELPTSGNTKPKKAA